MRKNITAPAITRGARRLFDWMRSERRTQQWIAEQLGTHQTSVSAWLKGRPITLSKALAMRELTGIAVEEWDVPADTYAKKHRASK